jgi:multidrug resistance efflux pump
MIPQNFSPAQLRRVGATLAIVALAAVSARMLWARYEEDPWTRDGRVRFDVADVAPDVSGLVTQVNVVDNMKVRRGQPLFVIDRARYELAVEQAEANLQQDQASVSRAEAAVVQSEAGVKAADAAVLAQRAQLAEAKQEDARNHQLGDLVSTETRQQGTEKVARFKAGVAQTLAAQAQAEASVAAAKAGLIQARATLVQAQAALDTARLNLQRTTVVAPVTGVAANVQVRPGNYLSAGKAAFGIVDASSLHVDGYFEETRLDRIRVGDEVTIQLMGDGRRLQGHVDSIAPGIADRERSPSAELLANVNPTFNWVRLAQRVPVRIHLDDPPQDLALIAGRTATVIVHPNSAAARAPRLAANYIQKERR